MFSVIGQPVPLLLDAQEESKQIPVLRMIANNKIFFIMLGFIDCSSIFALQIYISFSLGDK
jgi:hypothetical protein